MQNLCEPTVLAARRFPFLESRRRDRPAAALRAFSLSVHLRFRQEKARVLNYEYRHTAQPHIIGSPNLPMIALPLTLRSLLLPFAGLRKHRSFSYYGFYIQKMDN